MRRAATRTDPRKDDKILLFLKAPRAGFVKTRIGKTLGDDQALDIYRWLVRRLMGALPKGAAVEIHFAPADAGKEMEDWLGSEVLYTPQCEGDLGDRMEHAVLAAFEGGAKSVVCLGADCPSLMPEDIKDVVSKLEKGADAVFGPTHDGGYYLLGLRHFHSEIFREIPWSTERTLEVSLDRAANAGLKVGLLDKKSDIDEAADWETFCRENPNIIPR